VVGAFSQFNKQHCEYSSDFQHDLSRNSIDHDIISAALQQETRRRRDLGGRGGSFGGDCLVAPARHVSFALRCVAPAKLPKTKRRRQARCADYCHALLPAAPSPARQPSMLRSLARRRFLFERGVRAGSKSKKSLPALVNLRVVAM